MPKKGCISSDRVPCEKARKYLEKKGLLCPAIGEKKDVPKIPRKRRKRGLIEEWLG